MDDMRVDRILGTKEVAATDGTWAQSTRRGNLLFISGQVALDSKDNLVGKNDFEEQAKNSQQSSTMLKAGGASLKDLMMITVFVTDMKNRPVFAQVRDSYFRDNPPASTMVEIKRLVMDELMIEVNGIAVLSE